MNKRKYQILIFVFILSAGTVSLGAHAQMSPLDEGPSVPAAEAVNGKKVVIDVLDLKNMDVLDVMKLISQKSGMNIVASSNVKGRITVYLKNIEVREALKTIVEANAWAYIKEGDVLKVMTEKEFEDKYGRKFGQENQETKIQQLLFASTADMAAVLNQIKSAAGKVIIDEKTNTLILMDTPLKVKEMVRIVERIDVPIESKIFSLSYAKAEDLSPKVAEALTPTIGRMKFDTRSNKIVVTDTIQKIEDVSRIIHAFDQKEREVLIEAKIIQIALSDQYKMGVDWEAIVDDYHSLDLTSNFDILGATEKRGRVSIGTISDDDYEIMIEALDTVGVTDILSSPRITALNNQEAKILVGSTEPYVTSTTTTPSSGPTTTSESVNFIEVGVKLFVTPTIHHDDFITMKIKPEVSSVTSTITTGSNNTIPVVETSEAETTVLVKDGVTLVIGGLIKEEKLKTTKKVPVLGDIPLLKYAFSNIDDSVSKTEIVIFLRPEIITGDVADTVAMEYLDY